MDEILPLDLVRILSFHLICKQEECADLAGKVAELQLNEGVL